jgi:hypothetical protein
VNKLAYGMIAGIAATVGMTAAMRRMHARLPSPERYPLPPREIVGRAGGRSAGAEAAMLAHFGYGALTGGLFALQGRRSLAAGVLYGAGVWAGSYFGWVPLARILEPADRHPMRRNALMIAAHVLWGALLAAGLREIEAARQGAFRRPPGQPLADSPTGNFRSIR